MENINLLEKISGKIDLWIPHSFIGLFALPCLFLLEQNGRRKAKEQPNYKF